jgi:hypothetical protein
MLRAMASDATAFFENTQRRAPGWLAAWDGQGILVPNVKYVLVPNRRPPSREGHLFTDNTEAVIEAVSAWLAEQHL